MAEKKKVYVETSVISNLTARPSRSVIDMGHQVATCEWWDSCQGELELYSSSLVDREASKGDAGAAALRMAAPSSIRPKAYSNIIAPERIAASGLAMFLPAACG